MIPVVQLTSSKASFSFFFLFSFNFHLIHLSRPPSPTPVAIVPPDLSRLGWRSFILFGSSPLIPPLSCRHVPLSSPPGHAAGGPPHCSSSTHPFELRRRYPLHGPYGTLETWLRFRVWYVVGFGVFRSSPGKASGAPKPASHPRGEPFLGKSCTIANRRLTKRNSTA